MWEIRQDIYEKGVGDAYPVVSHRFYGRTRREARSYFDAHLTTDEFFRGCTERGRWDGIVCRTVERDMAIASVPPLRGALGAHSSAGVGTAVALIAGVGVVLAALLWAARRA
jgi:hypothetical protein